MSNEIGSGEGKESRKLSRSWLRALLRMRKSDGAFIAWRETVKARMVAKPEQ